MIEYTLKSRTKKYYFPYYVCLLFVFSQLALNKFMFPTDIQVIVTNQLTLTINLAFIYTIYKRSKNIENNIQNILLRIDKNEFINQCIISSIIDVLLHILIYLIILFIYRNNIYSFWLYMAFMIFEFIVYFFIESLAIVNTFIQWKLLKVTLSLVPVFLTLFLQIYVFQYWYQIIGGIV